MAIPAPANSSVTFWRALAGLLAASLGVTIYLLGQQSGAGMEPVYQVGPPQAAAPVVAPQVPSPTVPVAQHDDSVEPTARADPEDDPTLTDDYYDEAEEDGAEQADQGPRPDFSALPGNRSFSIGKPNDGWLVNGKALPLKGKNHRVLGRTQQRGWFWGSDALVRLIQDAAAAVARKRPGAILRVGNLSRRDGGKIGPSVSHQSGRDADIGLYALDMDSEVVDPPGFPKFDRSEEDTTGSYLFDVASNWTFVEALLSDKHVKIQWIFLDDPLKELLLDYGIRSGADGHVLDMAEKVIVRPKDSSPHANHFHIRIYCNEGDTLHGCADYGPTWKWVEEERAIEHAAMEDRLDRIMTGEEKLDLNDQDPEPTPETINGGRVPNTREDASPEDLRDPPTDIELKL